MSTSPRVVQVKLGPVHAEILRAITRPTARFVDVEGALRSAKTWTILIAIRTVLEEYPGIVWTIARWTREGLHQKLIPDYRNVCALMGLPHGEWNAPESCYDLANGSRLYAVHLKASQTDNKFAKVRGLTTAGVYINQLEEVPEDVYNEAALRLSQPGFPQVMVVDPNAVPESHWIARRWNPKAMPANHRYIRLAMRDNAHNLDAATIAAAEELYPVGHPMRLIKIEGRRGLEVSGTPVYLGAFNRTRHATRALDLNPELPLCEAYDYGFHHPCVVWYQWAPWGHLRVLGGVMGSDLHLDAFLPIVERYRQLWFSDRKALDATCDPAGANENAQGLRGTPVGMLRDWYREHGEQDADGETVTVRYIPNANAPERRVAATQRAATYMRRQVNGEEAFLVDPERWILAELKEERFDSFFVDGLEAGYVLEDEARHSERLGTLHVPKKDGWFEHPMNCFDWETQVLTRRGWTDFSVLHPTDELATVNLDTDALEYQQPTRLIAQPHRGSMLHFGGRLDARVTPDHRMVVYPRGDSTANLNGVPSVVKAAQDVSRWDRIRLNAIWQGEPLDRVLVPATNRALEKELDPGDFAEFLGWYVAEGCVNHCVRVPGHGYAVAVSQTPGQKRVLLESLLTRLPWRWYPTKSGYQASSQQLWNYLEPLGDRYVKRVPEWVKSARPEIIRRFLVGAVLGDGHVQPSGHQQYFTTSSALADDVQELFIKLGRSASIVTKAPVPYHIRGRSGDTREQYHVNEWQTQAAAVRDSHGGLLITEQPYDGNVYCASVPNGTLVVRRHGRPFIAGNCFEYGLQAHVLDLPLGDVHAEEAKIRHRERTEREARRELKRQQEDKSEPDERTRPRGRFARRGGY